MSKSRKTSIYLSAFTVDIINRREPSESDINISGAVNEIVNRYNHLFRMSLPDITEVQWKIILNAYAGCIVSDYPPPARIASDIMDDRGAISIEQLDNEAAEVVKLAHDWTQAQQYAVLEFVQRFWAKDWSDQPSLEAIKNQIING